VRFKLHRPQTMVHLQILGLFSINTLYTHAQGKIRIYYIDDEENVGLDADIDIQTEAREHTQMHKSTHSVTCNI